MESIWIVVISFIIAVIGLIKEGKAKNKKNSFVGLQPITFILILLSTVGMTFGVIKEIKSDAEQKRIINNQSTIVERLKGIEAVIKVSYSNDKNRLSTEETRQAQAYLEAAGLYKGPITGKNNPELYKAIKEFQKSLGMNADGIVGPKTRHYLENMTRLLNIIYSKGSNQANSADTKEPRG